MNTQIIINSFSQLIISFMTLLLAFYILAETFIDLKNIPAPYSYALILWSFFYFFILVVSFLFFSNKNNPTPPLLMIFYIIISTVFTISSFSIIYREFGIIDTLDARYLADKKDFLFFSTVTFSTLGFGDFRPTETTRLLAGLQAVMGNLHLGLLAGAFFHALQFRSKN